MIENKILIVLILIFQLFNSLYAEKFIADLSSNKIEIDSNFNGSKLLIFGTLSSENDLMVIVSSEKNDFILKKKIKKLGLWLGSEKKELKNMPTFYHLFSTKRITNLSKILNLSLLEIGIDNFRNSDDSSKNKEFFQQLIKIQQMRKLYMESYEAFEIKDSILFKANLKFPATVPLGNYIVQIILYNDYQLLSVQNIPITVDDKGFNQWLIYVATERKLLYLSLFILVTILAALINNFILKRIH